MLILPVMLVGCLLPVPAQHYGNTGFSWSPGSRDIGEGDQPDLPGYILSKHGPDPGLINGIQFYDMYSQVQGHPYFDREEPQNGSVTLAGKQYGDVSLNYDLYAQHLVLTYQVHSGGVRKIILVPEHTDAFSLGGDHFEKRSPGKAGPLFYQVIKADDITCYIHRRKEMVPTSNDLMYSNYFPESKRKYLLEYGGDLHSFRNRWSFKAIFPGELKKEVRKYLWRNRIVFREATTEELTRLLEYIVQTR
jgi:hypothetical protein